MKKAITAILACAIAASIMLSCAPKKEVVKKPAKEIKKDSERMQRELEKEKKQGY